MKHKSSKYFINTCPKCKGEKTKYASTCSDCRIWKRALPEGYKHTEETINKLKSAWVRKKEKGIMIGCNSPSWKGNNASMEAMHMWVRKILGQPKKCEICGKDGLSGKKIHWANVDHSYKRETNNWIRLCSGCHAFYDRLLKLRFVKI